MRPTPFKSVLKTSLVTKNILLQHYLHLCFYLLHCDGNSDCGYKSLEKIDLLA